MGITKKFVNMFKSGKGEEGGKKEREETQARAQTTRYESLPHRPE